MAATCRFVDEERLRQTRPGCPLAVVGGAASEAACARCPYNAAWPGEPSIGCRVSIPGHVWKSATDELLRLAPAVYERVHAVRGAAASGADGVDVDVARAVVNDWIGVLGIGSDGVECASVGHAFVAAATRTRERVCLWE